MFLEFIKAWENGLLLSKVIIIIIITAPFWFVAIAYLFDKLDNFAEKIDKII